MSELTRTQRKRLETTLAKIGPVGWTFCEGPEGLLRSERKGTHTHSQSSMSVDGLLEATRARERQIENLELGQPVGIHEGVSHTEVKSKR